jgi:signal transduction histidine kinase
MPPRPCMIANRPPALSWLAVLGSSVVCAMAFGVETPLRTALEVRSLPPEEAEKELPVALQGTVIFVDPRGSVLVQDKTAGTFFRGSDVMSLRVGDEVGVRGVTSPGMYLPGIQKATFEKLGHGETPPAAPVSYADLLSGRYHYQLVAAEGIVQSVTASGDGDHTILHLAMDQDLLEVDVYAPPRERHLLVDSRVRIEGLAAGTINHRRQLLQPILWLQDWSWLKVLKAAPPVQDVPTISASKLFAFRVVGQSGHRVRVAGTVVAAFSDGTVFIRDEATALGLQLQPPMPLSAGTRIEAIGFPKIQRFGASLVNTRLIQQVPGPEPPAIEASLTDLLNGAHDNDLVAVTATLSGSFRAEEGQVLVLQEGGMTFRVSAPLLEQEPPAGSRVRVTGICQVDSIKMTASGIQSLPRTVSLRCRGADDVAVLNSPSWWTVRRLALAVGVLLLAVALAGLWITVLRRQVRRQTTALRWRIEREAALDERQRIAREFHDTLEQGLTGLLLRLEAVQAHGVNEKGDHLLRASRGLVSQMQVETRSLVSELRVPSQENADLVAALQAIVDEHPLGCGPTLKLEASANLPPLPSRTVHHLRMIAREGVTNALKHARASCIRLSLGVEGSRLRMTIADDGQGFDSGSLHGGQRGHFGCIGIEERCQKFGGVASWRSTPGRGTTLEIELTLETSATAADGHAATPLLLHS